MSSRLKDLTGKVFHNLTVMYRSGSNRQGGSTWACRCICGIEKTFSSDHLTRSKSPVKSCGCLSKRSGPDNPQWKGVGEISGNWWYNHVLRERTQTYRTRVPVSITMGYAWSLFVDQGRKCSLSGVDLTISGSSRYSTASLDRIDNSKGYEEGNVQWVHKDINFMKRTYSQEYFIRLCTLISVNCGGQCEVK